MTPNPEYRVRYFALAKQLESANPNNVDVLEALAALSLEQKNDDAAIRYFDSAVKHGSTSPLTYEQLGRSPRPRETISRSYRSARIARSSCCPTTRCCTGCSAQLLSACTITPKRARYSTALSSFSAGFDCCASLGRRQKRQVQIQVQQFANPKLKESKKKSNYGESAS